jgi:hypothetical protein
MDNPLEILKYVIPAIVAAGASYLTLMQFLNKEEQKRRNEIILGNQKLVTPLRLQAYERVILFLERISPESMIIRIKEPSMNSQQLHVALLNAIRKEFEHNLSQQIYMTDEAWEAVKSTKESISQLVNVASSRVSPNDSAMVLSKNIIDMFGSIDESPIERAITKIKSEVIVLLGVPISEPEQ